MIELLFQLAIVEVDGRDADAVEAEQERRAVHPAEMGGAPRGEASQLEQLGGEEEPGLLDEALPGSDPWG
jgi:hypothetical protein